MSKSIQFRDEVIDVLVLNTRIGYNVSEKVGNVSKWLVTNHEGSFIHHSSFQLCCDLLRVSIRGNDELVVELIEEKVER